MELAGILDCAMDCAAAASAVHRHYAGRVDVDSWTEKGTSDFVTHVDREAETAIVSRISRRFPDHGIMAEEASTGTGGRDWVAPAHPDGWLWIVDPLDGTTNFLHGYPMYGVSIAASCNGVLQAGVVHNSITGETWHAVRGGGAFRDGNPIRVSAITSIRHALIGTGFPFKTLSLLDEYLLQFDAVLRNSSGVRRAGSAALDLCHVATGMFDGFWELSLQPWDIAAGALIVREAGGVVTTVDGSDDVVRSGSVLAGNAAIHAMLGELVRAPGSTAGPMRRVPDSMKATE
jgi:myo-inositol-1(or 4)-monophosphatase